MTLSIRAARSTDAGKLGVILSDANTAPPWKPRPHTGAQDIAFCGGMIDRGWVSVIENDEGRILGFVARDGEMVHALYVAGPDRGQGIGAALLNAAKALCDRLELWTFQQNTGARRFYQREGFAEAERGDGSQNDEGLPDVRLVWEKAT